MKREPFQQQQLQQQNLYVYINRTIRSKIYREMQELLAQKSEKKIFKKLTK